MTDYTMTIRTKNVNPLRLWLGTQLLVWGLRVIGFTAVITREI